VRNQNAEVLHLLKKRKRSGLTAVEAAMELDCWRLSARIYDLRLRGHDIVSYPEKHEGERHARYFLRRVK